MAIRGSELLYSYTYHSGEKLSTEYNSQICSVLNQLRDPFFPSKKIRKKVSLETETNLFCHRAYNSKYQCRVLFRQRESLCVYACCVSLEHSEVPIASRHHDI
jgi:hypothetical protein